VLLLSYIYALHPHDHSYQTKDTFVTTLTII